MRALIVFAALSLVPLSASAQDRPSFIEGFGGVRMTSAPGVATSLGGTFGVALTPGVQAIGEVGRQSDVMPSTIASIVALSPVDFRISSFYGEGGVRFVTNPRGHLSGYGEALAGVTRLSASYGELSNARLDALLDIGLRFFNTTEPIAGVGGGVIIQGGPLVATVGYRFNRIFADESLMRLISGGRFDVNEVRVGFGVRF
jgi:hypothetical protein